MAVIGLALTRARILAPLYIRNGYSPQAAYQAIKQKVGGDLGRNTFYANYREIASRFRWTRYLRNKPKDAAPEDRYITKSQQVGVAKYSYRFEVEYQDPKTGNITPGFLTSLMQERVSPEDAFTAMLDRAMMLNPTKVNESDRLRRIKDYQITSITEYRQPRRSRR